MTTRSFPRFLNFSTAIGVLSWSCAALADPPTGGASALSSESNPATDPARDTGADDSATQEASSRPEHLRLGVLGGIGFPRPLAIEGMVKFERTVAFGVEYSALPSLAISGVDTSFWALSADASIFPFQNAFFFGFRAGHQHLSADASVAVRPYGVASESLTVDTTFLNPRLGFLWTWAPGVTVGIDAGVQIALADSASGSGTIPLNLVPPEVLSVANSLGKATLPTIDLLRVGILL